MSTELSALDCPNQAAGRPHEWIVLERDDDLYQVYKCRNCARTVYEQLREFGPST